MKNIRNPFALLLALMITVLSGCGGNTAWVYEQNGSQIPAGLYINFMMAALSDLEAQETDSLDHNDPNHVHPTMKELLTSSTDGVKNTDIIRQEANSLSAEYFAVENKFNELGLTLNDDDYHTISLYTDYAWSSGAIDYELNGIAKHSIELYQAFNLKRSYVFEKMYGQDGERAISEEELRAEFEKDYARIEIMSIDVPQIDGVEDTAEKAKFENSFARYQQGEDIEQLDYEYRQSLAGEGAVDIIPKGEPGSNSAVIYTAGDNTGLEFIIGALRDAAIGEPMSIQQDSTYYIFKRLDLFEDPADFEEYRLSLVYSLKYEEFEQYLSELSGTVSMTANEASIKRYTPEKLKME